MTSHNKLVRDLIPEIIKKSGRVAVWRTLDESEYQQELQVKLAEEVQEYLEVKNVEELADVLEVLFALARLNGVGEQQLMEVRKLKLEERGGFEGRVFLQDVQKPVIKQKMFIWEAAILALQSLGRSATVTEIVEEIIRNDWYSFNSEDNKEWIIRTQMGRKAIGTNRNDVGTELYFEFLGENTYRLIDDRI
ncbi:nucleoside triphosphate pyrophosphohydrolase [Tumebacillus permanentifrigoris]|uniref:Putative house-cleaning noncanonical NTP pyrophosphatase (MazG superfamily) n=1 Tax=Tumebacillus permanentifrigoris TaxID=378543 RepID=A0A316D923_9BACL|nr:nucleoside triphosphate pyrophosphohydrolase [Tumebacillus permanentifrigoris]PWK13476.1 putative house-cleaning noncanonical NTP pyrophosphatase (MazG superfamily) [Tumebacillus permanentifrigoris]